MKGKARRLLSWVCVLALCMSLLPVTALAKTPETKAGQGTYEAVVFENIKELNIDSTNQHTVVYAIWTDPDDAYNIAIASQKVIDSVSALDENIEFDQLGADVALSVTGKDGTKHIDEKLAGDVVSQGNEQHWTVITLTEEQAKECFEQTGEEYVLNIKVSINEGGHALDNIKITKDFVNDTPLGDPEMDPTAHPIKIVVVLDGDKDNKKTDESVGDFIAVHPYKNTTDDPNETNWDEGTFHATTDTTGKAGTVTYSITYYDCKDIGFAAKDGYVIEAIDADLVYGQSGCQGIYEINNSSDLAQYGDYMADNVQGGSTVTVYVRSAYTVEYYQVENDGPQRLDTSPYNDTKSYVEGWTTGTTQEKSPENPDPDSDKYYRVCNCDDYPECGHKGFTGPDGSQPAEKNVYVAQKPDTTINLPVLPDVEDTKAVTGWYLNKDCNGEQKRPNSSVPVSNVKETDTDRVIKFYAKVTDKAQPNISVEKKLTAVERDGQKITDSLDNTTLYAGDKLIWTITVTNNGNAAATELKLEDVLKLDNEERSDVSVAGSNNIDPDSFTVPAKHGDTPGTVTFTATYTVTEADEGKTLTNTATVSGENVGPENPSGKTENPVGYTYTVTYNGNGGTANNQTMKQETVRTESNEQSVQYTVKEDAFGFDKPGYTFDGWYENADGTGEAQTGKAVTITKDTTYYAKWKENAPTVDAEKTTDKGTQSVKLGDTIQYTITIQAGEGNQGILKNFSVQDDKFPSKVGDITIKLGDTTPDFETEAALKEGILTFELQDALKKDQTLTITYSYTVTQDDVAKGEVTNSATVKAWNEDENQSGTDKDNTVTTPVEPVITLEKNW